MITCERAKELLSDYLENELAPDLRKLMEAHLKSCPGCQQLGAQVKFITAKLHSFESIHTTDKFDQQLRNRIINDPKLRLKSIPVSFQKLSFGFSGIAVLAALYFFVLSDANTTAPTGPSYQVTPGSGSMNNPAQQSGNNPALVNQAPAEKQPNNAADSLNEQQRSIDQERIRLIDQEQE